MINAYQKKKQPDLVRRELISAAIELSYEKGLSALTVQAVAEKAGVTKGGLLHHFPSKQKLILEVFYSILLEIEAQLEEFMSADPVVQGRFTRAYVRLAFSEDFNGGSSAWVTLGVSIIAEPNLRKIWFDWLKERQLANLETDNSIDLSLVRIATDGVWFNQVDGTKQSEGIIPKGLEDKLIAMTYLNKN